VVTDGDLPRASPGGRTGAKQHWRPPTLDGLVPVPTFRDHPATPASNFEGLDLDGQPVEVAVVGSGHWTLLIFLSTTCDGCLAMWEALGDPVGSGLATDEVVVAVTRDPGVDDPASLRAVAHGALRVVQSSAGWEAYRVQGPPFFALVDGSAGAGTTVATEGVAWAVEQIAADVARARGRA
jgi:hypothetical protein